MLACAAAANAANSAANGKPRFSTAVAFDVSRPLREITPPSLLRQSALRSVGAEPVDIRPDRGPVMADRGFSGDAALQTGGASRLLSERPTPTIAGPLANFEGLSNQDNFNLFGFRVSPPDPVGDVGPNHYVEMINLAYAVYDKTGAVLAGPTAIGDLWAGFAIDDCTDPSGDPIVLYDQLKDRWLLSQFSTRGPQYYDCVAISQTGDPTGAYYRYAFITQADPELPGGTFFPDYPKYGVWTDSYIMTTRDFGDVSGYGISVYALEKKKMIAGDPNARAVQFFLDSNFVDLNLIGDGLLPPDIDGKSKPEDDGIAAPIVGTQDDGAGYGGTVDAINIFDLKVKWKSTPIASLTGPTQLAVAGFDSIFPCGVVPGSAVPSSRDCLPQPEITDGSQYLDILSYRQRPTHRLAYRKFDRYEALVTNQSVEAAAGVAGVRWYEIRRTKGVYSIKQQGTFAPGDGVHRWMGSAAMDRKGNIALGYSVVNGVNVYPGIRYTGRRAKDPLGQMNLGEATIIDGSGVQTSTGSRWGDYSSLNVDPVDDCTFWYVNEYYAVSGVPLPLPPPPLPAPGTTAPFQTRIASFRLPGCEPDDD